MLFPEQIFGPLRKTLAMVAWLDMAPVQSYMHCPTTARDAQPDAQSPFPITNAHYLAEWIVKQ